MKILQGLAAAPGAFRRPAVTLGIFDGVHLGHRALLDAVRQAAGRAGGDAVVLTFDRHPLQLLAPRKAPPALQSLADKLGLLAASGVDGAVVIPFTPELAQMEAETFVAEIFVKALGARTIVLGEKFRFGYGGRGDVETLRVAGTSAGFAVEVLPKVSVNGHVVSSTRIRTLLVNGNVAAAARMLGRPYALTGAVEAGRQLGRRLGFPTVNLQLSLPLLLSPGVYVATVSPAESQAESLAAPAFDALTPTRADGLPNAAAPTPPPAASVEVAANGPTWPARAVVNVGFRPTVSDLAERQKSLEAHLLDFSGDLYGRVLTVTFHRKLRDEIHFPSLDDLVAQIRRDIAAAARY